MKFISTQRFSLLLILSAFLLLGIHFALATPPLESSDEYKHYPFVQYVQNNGELPVLDPDNPGLWLQEAAQPPLYYVLMALATSGIDTSDLSQIHQINPQAFIGNPGQIGNKNLIIHDHQAEAFPWQGSVLAIYVIRFLSLLLGVGTVFFTARLGTVLFNPQAGLLAAVLTAFNPMFLFVNAAVNNDSLSILLGSIGIYCLVLIWQDIPHWRGGWWRYITLGVVLGLGILTKLSLAGLLLLSGFALLWLAWREKKWSILIGGGVLIVVPVILICGWWFIRNWQLYGDLTGLGPFIAVQGTRENPLTWAGWLDELGTFYRSFWGLFGGVNIAAPQWFYWLMNGLALFALVGFGRQLLHKASRKQFISGGGWLATSWVLIIFILLLRWNLISPAFQGRLIFPALSALNVLLASGILFWFRGSLRKKVTLILSMGMFLLAFIIPFITIRPAYVIPQALDEVPQQAQIDPVIFAADQGQLRLVGVQMEMDQSVERGQEPVMVTLYWQLVETVDIDYISSLHLLGREFESVGQIDRFPAMGMLPTSRWQSGEIYKDDYNIYVNENSEAPAQLQVAVSLYDDQEDETLRATNTQGTSINPVLIGTPVRLIEDNGDLSNLDQRSQVTFEQGITLLGAKGLSGAPGDTIPLTLFWQAEAQPDSDYTVFVHLLDQQGNQIAGADAPPVNNFYPTSLWRAGDNIDDTHMLEVPKDLTSTELRIAVGLYDPLNGRRLVRQDGKGDHVIMPFIID